MDRWRLASKMSTVQIGNEFEDRVFSLFSKLLEQGEFFLPFKNYKIFQKKHYYSDKRQGDIIFDIAIESYLPEQNTPSFIVFVECKKYKEKVPISDFEEFQSKVFQIAPNANKAVLVTNSSFSDQSMNFARSNHIALVRFFDDDKIKWLVTREVADSVTYKEVKLANGEVMNAFIDTDYRIINNGFVFYDDEPIYNSLDFIESIYNSGEYKSHSFSDSILEDIYKNSGLLNSVEYLSEEKLIFISEAFRSELHKQYGNISLNFDINIIIDYLAKNLCFSVNFVDKLNMTRPIQYLAYVDYENKKIIVLKDILKYENRLKFTLVHELSHLILHRHFLECLKSNQNIIFLPAEIKKRLEFQANKLTSYILLPPNELKKELTSIVSQFNLNNSRGYYLYLDSQSCNQQQWNIVSNRLMNIFGVSLDVIKIRLQEIGFLKIGSEQIKTFRSL